MHASESLGKRIFHPEAAVPVNVSKLDHGENGYVILQLARQTREDPKDKYGWTLEPYRTTGDTEFIPIAADCGTCHGTGWYPEPVKGYKRPCVTCLAQEETEDDGEEAALPELHRRITPHSKRAPVPN